MAYYYRKVKCPYCNRWTDHFSSGSDVSLYSGSIVRTCRHCNKNFVDKSREEQALTYYKGTYRLRYVLAPLFFAVASTISFIVLFGADSFVLPTAIFGILSAVFMYLFVKAIYETSPKYRKAALEEKKFRRQFSIHWIALAIQIILTYMLSMGYRSLIGFTQESVTAENLQMKFGIKKL